MCQVYKLFAHYRAIYIHFWLSCELRISNFGSQKRKIKLTIRWTNDGLYSQEAAINRQDPVIGIALPFLPEKNIPIEVKIYPKISRSLRSFLKEYQPPKGILANLNQSSKEKVEKTDVWIVPAAFL